MTTYPLSDKPSQKDWARLGSHKPPFRVLAKKTGEFRPPMRGEWYLSGAIPEAYRAYSDLSRKFHIVELFVDNMRKTKNVDDEIRQLILRLYTAILDYHNGTNTTRPFEVTYQRDEELLKETKEFLCKTETSIY